MLINVGSKLISSNSTTGTAIALKVKNPTYRILGFQRTPKTFHLYGKSGAKQWEKNGTHQGRHKIICSRQLWIFIVNSRPFLHVI